MSSLEELKKDLEELKLLQAEAKRTKIKDVLSLAQHRIETDIINLEIKQRAAIEATNSSQNNVAGKSKSNTETKRYRCELHNYAWDQSDKFVKIFITLEGVQNLSEPDVTTVFNNNSMELTVQNLNNRDYSLIIKNLHSDIDVAKSYQKIKSDMVAIYMKKKQEKENWSHLTLTEKRVKDIKESAFKPDENSDNKDDPTAGIMNIMKKMYQDGDSETKKMIAKAWTESQEKQKNMDFD